MQYDVNLLLLINGLTGHIVWLDHFIANFSKYGPILFGIYLVGLWFTGENAEARCENRKQALYAVFSALLAMGVNQIIGLLWFRNRPYIDHPVNRLVSVTADASFPSDHAAGSFSIAGIILCKQSIGSIVLAVIAVLLSLSRIYVGVHYPSDILGGMAVGILSSMVINKNRNILEKPVSLLLAVWNLIEVNLMAKAVNSHSKEVRKNS